MWTRNLRDDIEDTLKAGARPDRSTLAEYLRREPGTISQAIRDYAAELLITLALQRRAPCRSFPFALVLKRPLADWYEDDTTPSKKRVKKASDTAFANLATASLGMDEITFAAS